MGGICSISPRNVSNASSGSSSEKQNFRSSGHYFAAGILGVRRFSKPQFGPMGLNVVLHIGNEPGGISDTTPRMPAAPRIEGARIADPLFTQLPSSQIHYIMGCHPRGLRSTKMPSMLAFAPLSSRLLSGVGCQYSGGCL